MENIIIIGVAGGTGSGKTTVANRLQKFLSNKLSCTIIQQDSYYIDRSSIPIEERKLINYDHPKSLDFELITEQLFALISGKNIKLPSYNFITHTREKKITIIEPTDIIIIEGILIFHNAQLRRLMNYKIFVDTPDDIRIIRRLTRDIHERGRSFKEGVEQYLSTVRPMHIEFVEPTKQFADIIVPEGGHNKTTIEMLGQSILK